MDEEAKHAAFMTALTTEHFVLQTAASSTIAEAGARSSLYLMTLSSALVAMGFLSQTPRLLVPFVATALPSLFLLGLLTVVRLVDTTMENMRYLTGIARIRGYYRTLGPEAATYFAEPTGRWPETAPEPSQQQGPVAALFGTTSAMIASINNVVAGVGVALGVAHFSGGARVPVALGAGALCVALLMVAFFRYQTWRFSQVDTGDR